MLSKDIKIIQDHYARELPFVVYRKPNDDEVITIFQNNNHLNFIADFSETGFVMAPYDTNSPSILLHPDELLRTKYVKDEKFKLNEFKLAETDNLAKARHLKLIEQGIEAIHKGDFKKVVLSRKMVRENRQNPFAVFQKLIQAYENAFCYLWYHPKVGLWLGATPELFLVKEGSEIKTVALASTIKFVDGKSPHWSAKEIEEQAMVARYIKKALGGIDQLKISEAEAVRAGNLWHLRTRFSGTYNEASLKNVIEALHPTPAVCGLPLNEANSFIKEYENYNRQFYTGYLGELNLGEKRASSLFVNLRCMQCLHNRATIYVGGGITIDSVPEQEWQETVLKTETLLKVLDNS